MDKFENVSVVKKSNIFFDGKCVSHSVLFPDGSRKTVGVIMPGSQLTFNVSTPELMQITYGT
ncbi:MAG: pyrimidine/purine nucleoside phosphorylase, partial [Candidatus Nitrotoga sp.]